MEYWSELALFCFFNLGLKSVHCVGSFFMCEVTWSYNHTSFMKLTGDTEIHVRLVHCLIQMFEKFNKIVLLLRIVTWSI